MSQYDLARLGQIRRVNVVGTSGSGKSTFGRQLASILGLSYVELDSLYWRPNWQPAEANEFLESIRAVTQQPTWLLDGNYSRTTAEKWQRVQLVVWLDLSFVRTIARVSPRCVRRAYHQQEIWVGTGNRETFRMSFFSSDSVIRWAITTYRRNRKQYSEWFEGSDYPHVWFVRLRSPKEVAGFLDAAKTAVADRASE